MKNVNMVLVYYKFSTNDEQRAEQMATLNELRTNTKIQQNKFTQEKEKRQVNMADRLNKIRLRKAKEMGIDLSTPSERTDKSQVEADVKGNSTETREPIPEKQRELNPPQPQLIEQVGLFNNLFSYLFLEYFQTPPTTRSQQQSSFQNDNQTPQNLNPSFAYPFPIMRANNISSSSISSTHTYDQR